MSKDSSSKEPLIPQNGDKNDVSKKSFRSIEPTDEDEKDLEQWSDRFRLPRKLGSEVFSNVSDSVSAEDGQVPHARAKKLRFIDIEAWISKKKSEPKPILKKVSGVARPGELTFIMGASGAGKTTLLNILTGRNLKNLKTDGEVLVNGRVMQPVDMRKISAYVQQEDVFISNLTVYETLHFVASLRSPKRYSESDRVNIVNDLIQMMGLNKCKNTRVGSMTEKSLSRGERKRLSFACEILTDPPILFCDEPTSGLDAFMSQQVMKALRQLTTEGKTVVCTIHQPSTLVYNMADKLILLALGHVVYDGKASEVDVFFDKCGYPTPRFISKPDHFMRVLSRGFAETEEAYHDRISEIHSKYKKTEKSTKSTKKKRSSKSSDHSHLNYSRPWMKQFLLIFKRSFTQLIRDKGVLLIKFIQTLIIALVVGMCYYQMSIHADHLESIKGFAFNAIQMMHLLFYFPAMVLLWKDYPVVLREYQSNMYSPSAYYLARTTADCIQYAVFPVLYAGITYAFVSIPAGFSTLFVYILVCLLIAQLAIGLAHTMAAAFGDITVALTTAPLLVVPMMVFGGFMIHYDTIPIYFKPFSYISWFKYSFEAIVIGFFGNHKEIEGCSQVTDRFSITGGKYCSTGEKFIEDLAFDKDNHLIDFLYMIGVTFLTKIVGTLFFMFRLRRS